MLKVLTGGRPSGRDVFIRCETDAGYSKLRVCARQKARMRGLRLYGES